MNDVLAAARTVAEEARARAREIETARRLPADLAAGMARAGLFRTAIPRAIGGLEQPPAVILEAIETIARGDASTGWCAMIGATTGMNAAYLAPEVAREIFGDPLAISGGVFAPTGRAEADGDDFVLEGKWQWASGSAHCHWLGAGAIVCEDGAPRLGADGAPEHRMLLFPAREARLIDTWQVAGLSGTGSGEMEALALRVPASRAVSLTTGKPTAQGALYAFPVFGLLALGVAAVLLGNAQGAMEELVDLAGGKRPRGSRRTLAERATAQAALAEAAGRLNAARAYFHDSVGKAWAKAQGAGAIDHDTRADLRLAATHAARTSADVTRALHELGGGSSVFLSNPLQRRLRDAQVAIQHMMVAAPTYELVGRVLMGLPAEGAQL